MSETVYSDELSVMVGETSFYSDTFDDNQALVVYLTTHGADPVHTSNSGHTYAPHASYPTSQGRLFTVAEPGTAHNNCASSPFESLLIPNATVAHGDNVIEASYQWLGTTNQHFGLCLRVQSDDQFIRAKWLYKTYDGNRGYLHLEYKSTGDGLVDLATSPEVVLEVNDILAFTLTVDGSDCTFAVTQNGTPIYSVTAGQIRILEKGSIGLWFQGSPNQGEGWRILSASASSLGTDHPLNPLIFLSQGIYSAIPAGKTDAVPAPIITNAPGFTYIAQERWKSVVANAHQWGGWYNNLEVRKSAIFVGLDLRQAQKFAVQQQGSSYVGPVENVEFYECWLRNNIEMGINWNAGYSQRILMYHCVTEGNNGNHYQHQHGGYIGSRLTPMEVIIIGCLWRGGPCYALTIYPGEELLPTSLIANNVFFNPGRRAFESSGLSRDRYRNNTVVGTVEGDAECLAAFEDGNEYGNIVVSGDYVWRSSEDLPFVAYSQGLLLPVWPLDGRGAYRRIKTRDYAWGCGEWPDYGAMESLDGHLYQPALPDNAEHFMQDAISDGSEETPLESHQSAEGSHWVRSYPYLTGKITIRNSGACGDASGENRYWYLRGSAYKDYSAGCKWRTLDDSPSEGGLVVCMHPYQDRQIELYWRPDNGGEWAVRYRTAGVAWTDIGTPVAAVPDSTKVYDLTITISGASVLAAVMDGATVVASISGTQTDITRGSTNPLSDDKPYIGYVGLYLKDQQNTGSGTRISDVWGSDPVAVDFEAGHASLQSYTDTTADLYVTASEGGTEPRAYQWHRSSTSGFTPGLTTALPGQTSKTLNDSGLTPDSIYYYVCVCSDSADHSENSNEVMVTTEAQTIVYGAAGLSARVLISHRTR